MFPKPQVIRCFWQLKLLGHSGNVSYGGSISQQQHTGFSSYQQSTPGQMPPAAQQQQQPPQPFGGVHPPPVSSVIGRQSL